MTADRVPGEFRYWQHLDHPTVRRIRAIVRRVLGFDPAPPDDVVRALAAMYFDADPLCEAFVDEVYLQRGSGVGREMLERALADGVDAVPDAPPSLRNLFADVERGARAFRRYGTAVFRCAGAGAARGCPLGRRHPAGSSYDPGSRIARRSRGAATACALVRAPHGRP